MSAETLTKKNPKLQRETEKICSIVLHNDDVNTFNHVIKLLVKVCDHTEVQAEQCAILVHTHGKCTVKSGDYEDMETIAGILGDNSLTVEIQ